MDDVVALVADAASRAVSYLAHSGRRPVSPPDEAIEALAAFDVPLPAEGSNPASVLGRLDAIGSPATEVTTGGRYYGFVNGGALPVTVAAHILATAWDQNVALPVMSPVGATLDRVAARWVIELLGLPGGSTAAFCSGASVANVICLIAARDAVLHAVGWEAQRFGLIGAPPIDVVVGDEAHLSVVKALGAAGLGRETMTLVPTDAYGRMIPAAVADALGNRPSIVVTQAGNVNSGYSDPFREISEACAGRAWLHVDGAFGLWAAASPSRRHQVDGVELADSWCTDGHKWPNLPYDCGVAICARKEDLLRSMATDAAYIGDTSERAPMHLGLQMSQRARGVEMYAAIAALGASGVADLVDRLCERATQLARTLGEDGVDVLVPPVLNQVLVAFGDDATTDAVITAVQTDGDIWAGGTTWKGRRAMRLSVSGWSTTPEDIAAAVAAIGRAREAVG